jgi:DNA-binding NarL/FixJ family response regulator
VFKKRPRAAALPSKREPAYWRQRLFKNSFTYRGQRVEVRSWSVKIQFFGKRKTFSLGSRHCARAAEEACQIYQTLIEHGWEATNHKQVAHGSPSRAASDSRKSPASIPFDGAYWMHRLILRKYPEPLQSPAKSQFSIRIEHARTWQYFPLGTSDEKEAALRAMSIYRTVINQGWDRANARFPRELSLALRWQDNPLAWTYTTIHTRPRSEPAKPVFDRSGRPPERHVVFIEPDAGIRFALAHCASSQEGYRCDTAFTGAREAQREIPRRRVDLVLTNYDLLDETGVACLEELHRVRPGLVVLSYSVFTDTDQLFKSTPGGAAGYMLKRTAPNRLFEPIASLTRTTTHEQIASHVRHYFHQLSAMLPSGPPVWKLAKLTPREQEVVALLSKGSLIKEIAGTLGISHWTVQDHMKSIFEKLKVHTRTEAVIQYLHG